jgi:branched-chain amino acid transport system substrate-binding protein
MTLNANHDAEIPVGILKYENGKRIYLGEIVPE